MRHFIPDPTDKRDTIDQRCLNCGFPFGDHYNSQCPDDYEEDQLTEDLADDWDDPDHPLNPK